MAASARATPRAAPRGPPPPPLRLRLPPSALALVLLLAACARGAAAVGAPDEVNSTGKGYVTIQRTTRGNASDDHAPAPAEAPAPPASPTPTSPTPPSPPAASPAAAASTAETLRATSLYSINGGKPFFLDRNPITGAVDFPAAVEYDEYVAADDAGDGIDRKDTDGAPPAAGVGRPSYNVFGAKAGNHKYYHSDKVPLISGSYANTKVQGTAGGAHRTRQPTSPTPTPSYYPVRPHLIASTVPRAPFTEASTSPTTTAAPATSTATPSPSSPASSPSPTSFYSEEDNGSNEAPAGPPSYEYEYEYVDNFAAEDGPATVTVRPPFTATRPHHRPTTPPPATPSRVSVTSPSQPTSTTVAPPTTASPVVSITPTTRTPPRPSPSSPQPSPSSVPASAQPPSPATTDRIPAAPASSPLVSRPPPPTSTILPTIIYKEPNNLVTSMPLGTHFHFRPASQPPSLPKQPEPLGAASAPKPAPAPNAPAAPPARPDANANANKVVLAPDVSPYGIRAEEPFRPIFGPGEGIEETVPPSRRPVQPQGPPPTGPVPSIPPETPTRLNYPPNEGTSSYFVLRPDAGPPPPLRAPIKKPLLPPALQAGQRPLPLLPPGPPPRQPGAPADKPSIAAGPKPAGSAPATWLLAGPGAHKPLVKFPGDSEHPTKAPAPGEEAKPLAHDSVRPPLPPPPPPAPTQPQGLPPRPPRPAPTGPLPSPATELRPPAQPDGSRPAWDTRPLQPPRPLQQHPHPHPSAPTHPHPAQAPTHPHPSPASSQPPAHARPKVDVVPPKYIQGGGGASGGYAPNPNPNPNANRNKPPPYMLDSRPYHDPATRPEQGLAGGGPGLPNILPQFRPNAKVSHGHGDNFRHHNRPAFFGNQNQHQHQQQHQHQHQHHHQQQHQHQLRAPLPERLHPPPPPPAPTRLNRNDAEPELPPAAPFPPPPPRPLMRRRTVPQGNEVATLQMMQLKRHPPPPASPAAPSPGAGPAPVPGPAPVSAPVSAPAPTASSEKRPVFVVYPTKSDAPGGGGGGGGGGDGGVVVGTRGPHLPVPPSNLRLDDKDDLPLGPPFGLAEPQQPLLQTAKERGDAPLLRKPVPERPIQSDFPYPLVRPDAAFPDADAADAKDGAGAGAGGGGAASVVDGDEREAFPPSRTPDGGASVGGVDKLVDDTDINIIPYLQDYMPFATKKPALSEKNSPAGAHASNLEHDSKARIVTAGSSGNKIQTSSIHLSPSSTYGSHDVGSSQTGSNYLISTTPKVKDYTQGSTKRPGLQQGLVGAGNSEFTVSAIMHTQPQFSQGHDKGSSVVPPAATSQSQSATTQHSNHRPAAANHKASSVAPALNFQAPFLASVNMGSAPTNQGWSVVGANTEQRMKPGTVDKAELDRSDVNAAHLTSEPVEHEPSNFDFENFKPQLFGGFQPIYSLPEDSKSQRQQLTTERQEKKLV